MKQILLNIFTFAFMFHLCHGATVKEAEYKLQLLREAASGTLEETRFQHGKLKTETDATVESTIKEGQIEIEKYFKAFEAKLNSAKVKKHLCQGSRDHYIKEVQRDYVHEMTHCIDNSGKDSNNFVSLQNRRIGESVWNGIYEEEKKIINCEHDESCLGSVIEEIEDKIGQLVNGLQDKINISRQNKNDHATLIRRCANKGIVHAKTVLHSFPLCVH